MFRPHSPVWTVRSLCNSSVVDVCLVSAVARAASVDSSYTRPSLLLTPPPALVMTGFRTDDCFVSAERERERAGTKHSEDAQHVQYYTVVNRGLCQVRNDDVGQLVHRSRGIFEELNSSYIQVETRPRN